MSGPPASSSTEQLFVGCTPGLEGALADECRVLGASRADPVLGGVEVEGPPRTAPAAQPPLAHRHPRPAPHLRREGAAHASRARARALAADARCLPDAAGLLTRGPPPGRSGPRGRGEAARGRPARAHPEGRRRPAPPAHRRDRAHPRDRHHRRAALPARLPRGALPRPDARDARGGAARARRPPGRRAALGPDVRLGHVRDRGRVARARAALRGACAPSPSSSSPSLDRTAWDAREGRREAGRAHRAPRADPRDRPQRRLGRRRPPQRPPRRGRDPAPPRADGRARPEDPRGPRARAARREPALRQAGRRARATSTGCTAASPRRSASTSPAGAWGCSTRTRRGSPRCSRSRARRRCTRSRTAAFVACSRSSRSPADIAVAGRYHRAPCPPTKP